jgi:adenylate cyclase
MGSETRFDYTAIGDAVNVAARLESGTKDLGVSLLVGEDTARFCAFDLNFVDTIKVKGKEKPLSVFSF